MARIKYMEIPRSDLNEVKIVAGQVIHCLDTGECFYDNANTIRILSEFIIPVGNINEVSVPTVNRLYIDRHAYPNEDGEILYKDPEYCTMYKYNSYGNWQIVTNTAEVNDFLSSYSEMEPAILQENGRNKAPITLANQVFTQTGDTVEDLVKEIKLLKVGMETIDIDNDYIMEVPTTPPYDVYHNYPKRNFTLVTVNGKLLPNTKYKFIHNKLTILKSQDALMYKDQVIILYIYQADLNSSDTKSAGYTDGGYIIDKTIPVTKLEKTTNSYTEDNPEYIPTAKALASAYSNMLLKLNQVDPCSTVYPTDSSSNNYEILVFIKKYVLSDANVVSIRTKLDLGTDCCLRINDLEPIPIYTLAGVPIKDGDVKKNTVINLRYNAQDNVFYLMNPDNFKIEKDIEVFEIDGQIHRPPMVTIPVPLENYIPGFDCVNVYQNNIRLFENINYEKSGQNIVLIGYFAKLGDVFVFERLRAKPSNT